MSAQFPPAGYGPPPGYGPPAGYGPAGGPRAGRRGNPAGIIVASLGGVISLLGTFLPWYEPDSKLSDLILFLDGTDELAFPKAYFGYLMWVLLGLTIVLALFGNAATPLATACRIAAPIVGVAGTALIIVSLNQLDKTGSIFDNSKPGLYMVLAGFVIAGAGGIFGPLRVR